MTTCAHSHLRADFYLVSYAKGAPCSTQWWLRARMRCNLDSTAQHDHPGAEQYDSIASRLMPARQHTSWLRPCSAAGAWQQGRTSPAPPEHRRRASAQSQGELQPKPKPEARFTSEAPRCERMHSMAPMRLHCTSTALHGAHAPTHQLAWHLSRRPANPALAVPPLLSCLHTSLCAAPCCMGHLPCEGALPFSPSPRRFSTCSFRFLCCYQHHIPSLA